MRNLIALLVLGLSLATLSCSTLSPSRTSKEPVEIRDVEPEAREAEETPRNRVLVLPFLDEKSDRNKKVAEAARQALIRELTKTRRFVVISLSDFPQDPKKFLSTDQEYDLPAVARVASNLGVAAVIEGKILEVRARKSGDSVGLIRQTKATVETQTRLRVVAGRSGKEILNETRSATEDASNVHLGEETGNLAEDPDLVKQSVRKAFAGALPNLVKAVEKLSWEGRVAMVSGEKIYVNAGRLSGIQVGDVLKVTEDGEDVYDPENGKFLGTAPGRMKGTVEVVSYFGKDGSITVIHSGSGFQENDRVELY